MGREVWSTRLLNTLKKRYKKTLSACNQTYPDIEVIEKQYAKCLDLQSQLENRVVSKEDYAEELEDIEIFAESIKNRIDELKSAEVSDLVERIFVVGDYILNFLGIPSFLSPLLDLIRDGKRAIGWTTQERLEWDDDD